MRRAKLLFSLFRESLSVSALMRSTFPSFFAMSAPANRVLRGRLTHDRRKFEGWHFKIVALRFHNLTWFLFFFSVSRYGFSIRENTVNGVISAGDCKICKDTRDEPKDSESASLLCALKPRKRKERRESCCQERKLIRYCWISSILIILILALSYKFSYESFSITTLMNYFKFYMISIFLFIIN